LATLAESELVIQPAQLVDTIHEEMKIHQVEQMLPSAGIMTDSPQGSILKELLSDSCHHLLVMSMFGLKV